VTKKQLDSQALRLLNDARVLIGRPEHWGQGALARNARGQLTKMSAPDAICFCSAGALQVAMRRRIAEVNKLVPKDCYPEVNSNYSAHFGEVYDYLTSLAGLDLIDFNDDRDTKYADVVNLFDLAIDNAEERVYE